MSAQTEYLKSVLSGVESQVNNSIARNRVLSAIEAGRRRLSAREELSEDPDLLGVEAFYNGISNKVDALNATQVRVPSLSSIASDLAGIPAVE